jgi:hypothetical protein
LFSFSKSIHKACKAWAIYMGFPTIFMLKCELSLSRFADRYLLMISLLVFTFRKGISQLLECDDCTSFMSKYSTRNASCIYIVEPSEVRNVVAKHGLFTWVFQQFLCLNVNCRYHVLLIDIFLSITFTIAINRTLTNPPFSKYI